MNFWFVNLKMINTKIQLLGESLKLELTNYQKHFLKYSYFRYLSKNIFKLI